VLGRRTAELHAALADVQDAAFTSEVLDIAALDSLADDMRMHANVTLDLLEARLHTLQSSARLQADALVARRSVLLARFDEIRELNAAGRRIRIHGDYHLGQVLRTEEDFFILDFEGDRARPLVERRARQSPLRDVAAMMRSFSYSAYAALFAFTVNAPADVVLLEPWAAAWERWIGDAFLREYQSAVAGASWAPDLESFPVLLRAFVLNKALYELTYELNNRVEWVRIPLAGLCNMSI
jgi:maltose alpha-D-glucosyltransferase/alpha-amylase